MATFDFTPLYRSTVGFDRIPSLLSHALDREESGFPPYNIEKTGDDTYRIVMALAGFARDDVEIVTERFRAWLQGLGKGPGARHVSRPRRAARRSSPPAWSPRPAIA